MNMNYLNIPTTYSPLKDENDEYNWCSLDHVCPSNIIWIKFKEQNLYHLLPRKWLPEGEYPSPKNRDIRSDGMYYYEYRDHTLCGLDITYLNKKDYHIILLRRKACPDCWIKRW